MAQAPVVKGFRPGVADIKAIVASTDLSRYIADLRHYDGMSAEEADRCAELFKKFCVVAAANPGVYVWDHKEADRLLHALIKYQPEYPAFCNAVFGGLLHHRPMIPGDELPEPQEVTIERTRHLWKQIFGEDFDKAGTVYH
ncbi:MAG: hypothetical protein WAZ27_01150 [Minisyncoccia bacterium]